MEQKNLSIRQRTQRYWYEDGLPDLMGGSSLLFMSLLYGLGQNFPQRGLFFLLAPLLVIIYSLLMRFLLVRLKKNVVFPRTGYIAYKQVRGWRLAIAIIASFIGGIAITQLAISIPAQSFVATVILSPLTLGTVISVVLVWLWSTNGVRRFLWYTLLALMSSAVLQLLHLPMYTSLATFTLVIGITWIISGTFLFRRYLATNLVGE